MLKKAKSGFIINNVVDHSGLSHTLNTSLKPLTT